MNLSRLANKSCFLAVIFGAKKREFIKWFLVGVAFAAVFLFNLSMLY